MLTTVPRLIVRTTIIDSVFGSHYFIYVGVYLFSYAFDKVNDRILDVSWEKPSEDAVVLFTDTILLTSTLMEKKQMTLVLKMFKIFILK